MEQRKTIYLHLLLLFIVSGSILNMNKGPYLLFNLIMALYWMASIAAKLCVGINVLRLNVRHKYILTILATFVLNMLINHNNIKSMVECLAFLNMCFYLIAFWTKYEYEIIEQAYLKYVKAFAYIAIPLFVLGIVAPNAIHRLPIIDNRYLQDTWALGPFYFQQSIDLFGYKLWRMQLFFWEPAILALYFFVGLLFVILRKPNNTKLLYLLLIGIMMTFSTTGLICALIAIFLKYVVFGNKTNMYYLLSMAIIIILIGYFTYLNIEMKISNQGVFDNGSIQYDSSLVKRVFDMMVSLKAFKEHPIFGIGFNVSPYTLLGYDYDIFHGRGITNGIIAVITHFGLIGLVWFLPLIKNIISNRDLSITLYMILFLIIYMGEPLTYTPLFFILALLTSRKRLCFIGSYQTRVCLKV